MAEHLGIFCRMNARVRFTSGAALCGQMNQKINFLKNKISCLYTRSLINSSCAWTVDWISPRVCRRINSSAKCAAISAGAEGELLSLSQIRSLHNFIQEVSEWVSEWQKPPRCCSLSHISVHDWLTFTEGNAIMWKIRWEGVLVDGQVVRHLPSQVIIFLSQHHISVPLPPPLDHFLPAQSVPPPTHTAWCGYLHNLSGFRRQD